MEQQGKRKHGFIVKTNNSFECGLYLAVRVCTTKGFFSEHVFIKVRYRIFKIVILKVKSFLTSVAQVPKVWPSQYKFIINEFLIKKLYFKVFLTVTVKFNITARFLGFKIWDILGLEEHPCPDDTQVSSMGVMAPVVHHVAVETLSP